MFNTMLPTVCQSCEGAVPVEYRWLGAPAECPRCGRQTIPVMPVGAEYPIREYELSFAGFNQLLGSGDRSVKKFLKDGYGYSLVATAAGARVVNEGKEAIDIAWLHARIQDDAAQQREIYGLAMMLWR
jgi:hypothetical protein